MFSLNLLSIVIGASAGIGCTVLAFFPTLKKKGVDTQNLIDKADMVLTGVDGLISVVDKIIPNNPAVNVIKVIDKYAHIAVNQAEQLYIASQLQADQRNAKAKETISAVLKTLNIEVTPEIKKIIDGAIEAEVLALGHKQPSEAEKQAALQKLQAEKAQLVSENTQLKTAIATVASTVQIAPQILANTVQPIGPAAQ